MQVESDSVDMQLLAKLNAHPRDKNITFQEKGHLYFVTITNLDGSTFILEDVLSVTTWNKTFFKEFDAGEVIRKMKSSKKYKEGHRYWNMTDTQIRQRWNAKRNAASDSGTNLHEKIERFFNHNPPSPDQPRTHGTLFDVCSRDSNVKEWLYFLAFVNDHRDMIPYRTEWRIYHEELHLAGSVDIVYRDPAVANGVMLADWKRTGEIVRKNNYGEFAIPWPICHIHNTNFWHYALQLNTYKYILESKYGVIVTKMFLVQLHPDSEESTGYQIHDIPDMSLEMANLVQGRLAGIKNVQVVK